MRDRRPHSSAWDTSTSTASATTSRTGGPAARDVSFRVGDGAKVALVGANGAGKTTLLRMVAGDLDPHEGSIGRSGGLGVMRQFVGVGARRLVGARPAGVGRAAAPCARPPRRSRRPSCAMMERDDERTQMRYAQALADWADAGGYEAEVAVGHLHGRGARHPVREGAVARGAHAVRRRAEAARARGAAARPGRGAAARRAGQLPRRARQAVARGGAARDARRRCCSSATTASCWPAPATRVVTVELGAGGQHRLDARRRLRDLPRRRGRTGSRGSRSCAAAGTRSTPSSRRWS